MKSLSTTALMALMALIFSPSSFAVTFTEQLMRPINDGIGIEERVYDGVLPTEEHKITLPAARDEHGRVHCVQLLRALMNAPLTDHWHEGRKLKTSWSEVKPGTAIATFKQGRYPQRQKGHGGKHAAIFLRATDSGIYVFDQFSGARVATERFIPWHNPRDRKLSNNAASYSTVRW